MYYICVYYHQNLIFIRIGSIVGHLVIVPLKGALLGSFEFGLPVIRMSSALEMIASLVELIENLTLFLNSTLSFFTQQH